MFVFIKGVLISSSPLSCVIDVNGVGYKLFIPASNFGKLPQIGQNILLHSSFIVREMSQALYGFLSPQERDVFELLMGVTGVGPKLALSIIGHLTLQDLQNAILTDDIIALSKIPGIGKKSAERLIVELRGKLDALVPSVPSDLVINIGVSQTIIDAMSALIHLGYNQNVAQKAIKKTLDLIPDESDLATLITHALKHL